MQFCQPCYDKLREAIKARGMWPLVGSDETLKEKISQEVDHIQGGPPPDARRTFDPLYQACMAIYGRAIQMGGLYLMTGDYCPLCELDKNAPLDAEIPAGYTTHGDAWIGGCCDAQLAGARELGLMPEPQ